MPNRLRHSSSPYLRQHADNPVDWHEWGDEAFDAARQRGVPVLLSVGYSACHWCHVMAHESFEDPDTAVAMNEQFVSIKVDREERPDVDAIYMEATQAITGHGGWPMTVWLDHDGAPFYAGTYFPKDDRHGMPAFRRVMDAVTDAWTNRPEEVAAQTRQLMQAITRTLPARPTKPESRVIRIAVEAIVAQADRSNGGFGGAPKFPQAPVLDLLLRVYDRGWAGGTRAILGETLTAMARGGIYDQIGGGFARYSVDAGWLVPHFEKMLYDNAQLARIYLWAWTATGMDDFRRIAEETMAYMVRDLGHPSGGFYAAEDADSEGVEGKFYVWDSAELEDILEPGDYTVASAFWGVTPDGNFEGSNILHVKRSVSDTADFLGSSEDEILETIGRVRRRLLTQREERVRPGLDNKIIASWNGLALRAFAEAGAVLDRPDLIDTARRCARFLLDEMVEPDGRVVRHWTDGTKAVKGFLEDQASVALGLWALYSATGEEDWYHRASSLVDVLPEQFADTAGGFHSTAADGPNLIKRPKAQFDSPLPSGNSMAAEALFMSAAYRGKSDHMDLVRSTIDSGGALIEQYPSAVGSLLGVVDSVARGAREVAITGPAPQPLIDVFWSRYRPNMVLATSIGEQQPFDEGTPSIELLDGRRSSAINRAFVCRDFVCDAPVTEPRALAIALEASTSGDDGAQS